MEALEEWLQVHARPRPLHLGPPPTHPYRGALYPRLHTLGPYTHGPIPTTPIPTAPILTAPILTAPILTAPIPMGRHPWPHTVGLPSLPALQ
eukprot:4033325-Prymnesium_polylepis.1